jgi:hypothetical protein
LHEGQLIVLSVHAGFYAKPDNSGEYTLDLRTTAGQEWNNEFKFQAYPNGMVNRKLFDGSYIVGPDKWASSIEEIITLPPDVQIKISNNYNPDSRKVISTVYSRFINPLAGTYLLTVCIVEDSIIGAQKNNNPNIGPSPDWYNYVFNDVLRGSLNGSYGEVLTTSPDTELTYLGRFSSTIDPSYDDKNCWIMAFVSNSSTKEIIQAEKVNIMP